MKSHFHMKGWAPRLLWGRGLKKFGYGRFKCWACDYGYELIDRYILRFNTSCAFLTTNLIFFDTEMQEKRKEKLVRYDPICHQEHKIILILQLPFPQTVIEPFESPVMTSPLGENSKHVKYCGISYFYQIKKTSNSCVTY